MAWRKLARWQSVLGRGLHQPRRWLRPFYVDGRTSLPSTSSADTHDQQNHICQTDKSSTTPKEVAASAPEAAAQLDLTPNSKSAPVAAALRSLDPRLLQRPAPQHSDTSALPKHCSCSRHSATSFARGRAKCSANAPSAPRGCGAALTGATPTKTTPSWRTRHAVVATPPTRCPCRSPVAWSGRRPHARHLGLSSLCLWR